MRVRTAFQVSENKRNRILSAQATKDDAYYKEAVRRSIDNARAYDGAQGATSFGNGSSGGSGTGQGAGGGSSVPPECGAPACLFYNPTAFVRTSSAIKRKIKTTAQFNGGLIQQAPKPLGRERIVAASTIPAQIDPLDDGYLSASLIKGAAPTTGSGYNYLLSVGPIAVGTQASAVVYLTNRTSQQLTLQATASGSYTTMQLEAGNSQDGVGTLKMAPESEVALTVWFKPTDISQQNLQRVVIQGNNERPIDVILVYVLLGAPSLTLTNTAGPFVSGLGGSWNKPHTACHWDRRPCYIC